MTIEEIYDYCKKQMPSVNRPFGLNLLELDDLLCQYILAKVTNEIDRSGYIDIAPDLGLNPEWPKSEGKYIILDDWKNKCCTYTRYKRIPLDKEEAIKKHVDFLAKRMKEINVEEKLLKMNEDF